MRFVTFEHHGSHRVGVIAGSDVLDVTDAFPTMLALIDGGEEALAETARRLESGSGDRRALAELRLRAPIPAPRRDIFAVGLNYRDHLAESTVRPQGVADAQPYPAFFVKATGTVIGAADEIGYPAGISEQLDYEAELAVVIGRRGRDIPVADAERHVFGYTLANDVTVRDVQRRHGGQWNKGKSFDRMCPLGPFIVTPDEIDLPSLTIECDVNGESRQSSRVGLLIFDVPTLIAELSVGMTLLPGDIILTGTPSGVGYARTPPLFLRPGDQVVVRSNQLGELVNTVGTDLGPLARA